MKLIIGSDHFGFDMKEDVKAYLVSLGHEVVDAGAFSSQVAVDYPDVGREVAEAVARGEFSRGILICGTGIGMAIVANKVPGVRAACCHDPYSAERARKSNDAQIITFGAAIVAPTLVHMLLDIWLAAEFSGGRSAPKVEKINQVDRDYRGF